MVIDWGAGWVPLALHLDQPSVPAALAAMLATAQGNHASWEAAGRPEPAPAGPEEEDSIIQALRGVVDPAVAALLYLCSAGADVLGTELTTDRVRSLGVVVSGALITVLIRRRVTDPACGNRAMRGSARRSAAAAGGRRRCGGR